MSLSKIGLFLFYAVTAILVDDNAQSKLNRVKEQFIKFERLEENIEDSSFASLDRMKKEFKELEELKCNLNPENVNFTLGKIYQSFETQERKILRNSLQLTLMKEIIKNLLKLMKNIAEDKDDMGSTRTMKLGFKLTESLPTSFSLENLPNKNQTDQTEQYLSYTKNTIAVSRTTEVSTHLTTTARSSLQSLKKNKEIADGLSDCETPPMPSTYCHKYQILWYFSTEEGRCNRFRKGCEDTSRNSYPRQADCKAKCVRPGFKKREACFLPRSSGICNGIERRWYFDWRENRCRDFIYSGCLGNQNRFQEKKSCWQQCGLSSTMAKKQNLTTNNSQTAENTSKKHKKNEESTATYVFPRRKDHFIQQNSNKSQYSIQTSLPSNKYESQYPDYLPFMKNDFGRSKQINPRVSKKKDRYFKGRFQNKKQKYRHFLYRFDSRNKRTSKVSKTINLRVELHAPKYIDVDETFKLKCIVSGSLAEAQEIIWDRDDDVDDDRDAGWKKRKKIKITKYSGQKISTLYVSGIQNPVRFTCLVSCYDFQSAKMLPEKLKKREKIEKVENYLCAFDSVKLKPRFKNKT